MLDPILAGSLVQRASYNALGQVRDLGLFKLTGGTAPLMNLQFVYDGGGNNGNMLGQNFWIGGTVNSGAITGAAFSAAQSYGYDGLNRLTLAQEGSNWRQAFDHDDWGNRWIDAGNSFNIVIPTGTPLNKDMYNTRNQLAGKPYDSAGNGSPVDGRSYQYDVENRIVSISGGTAETAESFTYDGDGRRVKRVLNGVTTTYVYDAFGQMAQEYGGTPGPAGRSYLFADHLGSTRMRVDGNGVAQGWWDYLPYGEEITGDRGNRSGAAGWAYGGAEPSMMFTGQTRDRLADGNTSGLDYFGARYMSPGQGRWTSPDVINLTSARLINPSNTLNKYEYAGNNPFKYVDPDGRDLVAVYKPTGTPGHFWLVAYNERSGDFAVRNFGPVKTEVETLYRTVPGSDWAKQFATELANPDQLKQYAVLTIQTNPEEAQKVIDQINSNDPVPLGYNVRDRNCTTVCREALSAIMALDSRIWRPQDLWNTLWYGYSNRAISTGRMSVFLQVETAAGKDHGRPRWGLDTFDFLSLIIKLHNKAPEPKACVSVSDSATGTSTKPECK